MPIPFFHLLHSFFFIVFSPHFFSSSTLNRITKENNWYSFEHWIFAENTIFIFVLSFSHWTLAIIMNCFACCIDFLKFYAETTIELNSSNVFSMHSTVEIHIWLNVSCIIITSMKITSLIRLKCTFFAKAMQNFNIFSSLLQATKWLKKKKRFFELKGNCWRWRKCQSTNQHSYFSKVLSWANVKIIWKKHTQIHKKREKKTNHSSVRFVYLLRVLAACQLLLLSLFLVIFVCF